MYMKKIKFDIEDMLLAFSCFIIAFSIFCVMIILLYKPKSIYDIISYERNPQSALCDETVCYKLYIGKPTLENDIIKQLNKENFSNKLNMKSITRTMKLDTNKTYIIFYYITSEDTLSNTDYDEYVKLKNYEKDSKNLSQDNVKKINNEIYIKDKNGFSVKYNINNLDICYLKGYFFKKVTLTLPNIDEINIYIKDKLINDFYNDLTLSKIINKLSLNN